MTKTTARKAASKKPVPKLVREPQDAPAAAPAPDDVEARRAACEREILEVLARHRCGIVPQPFTEPMGRFGESMVLRVNLLIAPMEAT